MVTDFGLSDYEEELSPESPVCGTATYLAPEVGKRLFIVFHEAYRQELYTFVYGHVKCILSISCCSCHEM